MFVGLFAKRLKVAGEGQSLSHLKRNVADGRKEEDSITESATVETALESSFKTYGVLCEETRKRIKNIFQSKPPSLSEKIKNWLQLNGKRECKMMATCVSLEHDVEYPCSVTFKGDIPIRFELSTCFAHVGEYQFTANGAYGKVIDFPRSGYHPYKELIEKILLPRHRKETLYDFLRLGTKMVQEFEQELTNFVNSEVEQLDNDDVRVLFRMGVEFQGTYDWLLTLYQEKSDKLYLAQAELTSIICGLTDSKRFTKSPKLKEIRERAEKLLASLSAVE